MEEKILFEVSSLEKKPKVFQVGNFYDYYYIALHFKRDRKKKREICVLLKLENIKDLIKYLEDPNEEKIVLTCTCQSEMLAFTKFEELLYVDFFVSYTANFKKYTFNTFLDKEQQDRLLVILKKEYGVENV